MKTLNFRSVCALTLLSGTICFGQTSNANELLGTWQMTGQECQSGATAKGMGEHMTGRIDGVATFTADQIIATLKVSYKLDKAYAEEILKQLQDALKAWDQVQDNEQKQKAVADINRSIAQISKMSDGQQCNVNAIRSYSVHGDVIHSEPISSNSDCGGDSASNDNKSDDSKFELVGDTLKLIGNTPETKDDGQCPKGDLTLNIFKKLK